MIGIATGVRRTYSTRQQTSGLLILIDMYEKT